MKDIWRWLQPVLEEAAAQFIVWAPVIAVEAYLHSKKHREDTQHEQRRHEEEMNQRERHWASEMEQKERHHEETLTDEDVVTELEELKERLLDFEED